jgi:hypothetical protein
VIALRSKPNATNATTYVALTCSRPTRHTMKNPSVQITAIGQMLLPHWTLSTETVAGARNRITLTPKFDGFHR